MTIHFLFALLTTAASAAEPEVSVSQSTVSAVVEIDPAPGAKKFQGVWLVQSGGEKLLVDYRKRGFWLPFEGLAVDVTGEHWTPVGQAIMAPHFRVFDLRVRDPQAASTWVALGPEQSHTGAFSTETGEPGSKGAHDSWTVFGSDTATFRILNPAPAHTGKATVTLRAVEYSPFAAHAPGPYAWVVEHTGLE